MEVSEDMADKTRKALAEAAPYVSTPVFVEVAQFFDRLSPPAPEVDEATVWTLKVLTAWGVPEHVLTEITFKTMLANARTALSELIASKDAEIERLEGELDELKNPIYCAICGSCGDTGCGCTHKCLYPFSHPDVDTELAALRAENERLRITLRVPSRREIRLDWSMTTNPDVLRLARDDWNVIREYIDAKIGFETKYMAGCDNLVMERLRLLDAEQAIAAHLRQPEKGSTDDR